MCMVLYIFMIDIDFLPKSLQFVGPEDEVPYDVPMTLPPPEMANLAQIEEIVLAASKSPFNGKNHLLSALAHDVYHK